MDGHAEAQDFEPMPFYIGHYEADRQEVVGEEVFHHAEDLGYDFLTANITNRKYRDRVLKQIKQNLQLNHTIPNPGHAGSKHPFPTLSPISGDETDIEPSDISSRLLYIVSDWLDLTSSNVYVADAAKQVLLQEVTYAGFCGATNVLLRSPSLDDDSVSRLQLAAFADAVRQASMASPGVGISILFTPGCEGSGQPADGRSNGETMTDLALSAPPKKLGRKRLDPLSSWDVWHTIRTACKYDNRISVALVIPKKLPPRYVLDRWISEPVRVLYLPATSFTPNQRHVNVLAKSHQQFLARCFRAKVSPWVLLSGVGSLPGLDTDGEPIGGANGNGPTAAEVNFAQLSPEQTSPYLMYLREHLQRRQPARSIIEKYGAGYQDWPQSPLQPLADNLDSVTYEVFEKDPVKYAWYECAVRSALEDFESQGWTRAGRNGSAVVVAVVGAGRGPLMQRVLQASQATGVEVEAWALEKNPSAFVHLQKRNKNEWENNVNLVQSDMRSWTGPVSSIGERIAINILVSELLGSLADNELSPECLDGVQHLLHPTHGISIPSDYSAYITPIAGQELWRGIKYRATQSMGSGKMADPMLLPYVSWLHSIDYLSTDGHDGVENGNIKSIAAADHPTATPPHVKKLWDFQHPVPQKILDDPSAKSNYHNTRTAHHIFRTRYRGVCHGIAGYFDSTLYDRDSTRARLSPKPSSATEDSSASLSPPSYPWPADPSRVVISTNPLSASESPDMISWFPLFFPFKTPFYVPDDAELAISIWRRTDGRGVWYEWCAEVFTADGSKCGESGWHSSESVPCLM